MRHEYYEFYNNNKSKLKYSGYYNLNKDYKKYKKLRREKKIAMMLEIITYSISPFCIAMLYYFYAENILAKWSFIVAFIISCIPLVALTIEKIKK